MKRLYAIIFTLSLLIANTNAFSSSYFVMAKFLANSADTAKKQSTKISDTRKERPSYLKSGVDVTITPFKPLPVKHTSNPTSTTNATLAAKPPVTDLKVLSNVKVYPNPVEERLNLSYNVNKDSNVTIKIMDVLGNEIATLLSQRMPAGEQVNTFSISSKLNSGYYFIRLIVGNETIIKRISIL